MLSGMDRAARRNVMMARYLRRRRCLWVLAWSVQIIGWLLIAAMVAGFAGAILYYRQIHRDEAVTPPATPSPIQNEGV